MSSNILDKRGWFVGLDAHSFYTIGPEGIPLPVPMAHVVGQTHAGGRFWRMMKDVKAESHFIIQSNWSHLLVTHAPLPVLPPHPFEVIQLLAIIDTSSSAPILSLHSVTGHTQSLMAEISGSVGLNSDCGLQLIPVGVDINLSTVVTTPSKGDYAAAAVNAALSGVYNFALASVPGEEPLASLGISVIQNGADAIGKDSSTITDPVAMVINYVNNKVQQMVDS